MRVKVVPFMLTGNVGAVTEYCYRIRVMCVKYVFVWIELDSAFCAVVFSIYYV
jgi:hypothetical protein